jgi:hypothetical protein
MYDDTSDNAPISPQDPCRNPVLSILEFDLDSDNAIPQSLTQNHYPLYNSLSERELDDENPSDYLPTQDSDADEPEVIVEQLQRMVCFTYVHDWYA